MCSRISRAFLLSSSRHPYNQNNNQQKNFGSGTSDRPDLETKVDHEFGVKWASVILICTPVGS